MVVSRVFSIRCRVASRSAAATLTTTCPHSPQTISARSPAVTAASKPAQCGAPEEAWGSAAARLHHSFLAIVR